MKKYKLAFIYFMLLFLSPISIKAQDTLDYLTDTSLVDIAPFCKVYLDEKAILDFEQIKNLPDDIFKLAPSGRLSFGNTNATVWLKFVVKNQTAESLYLDFWGFGLTYLDVYTFNENNELTVRQSGTLRAFNSRDLNRGHIAINIGQSPRIVYISLKSRWMLNMVVSLSALKPLSNSYYVKDTFNGICMGILIAMLLYNLFLFFSVRERLYLYYAAYILMALVVVSEMNSSYRFFIGWGMGVGIREFLFISGILFTMSFLSTRTILPRGHKVLMVCIIFFCLSIILSILNCQPYANQFYHVIALFTIFAILFLAILVYRRGNKSAMFFSIAWFFVLFSGFVSTLTNIGILPFTFWTNNVFAIGTCLETILLAFALAYRLKTYRDVSESAQELAIQRLEENERLVKEQNKVLEENVLIRTTELHQSVETLKATQNQLIQQEKLASLGELTAGIAHEIQNPLNFVNNFSELSVDIAKDLNTEMHNPEPDKVFIEELLTDLTSNQVKIIHHSKRASDIVRGMLQHSRSSSGQKEPTDINALCDEYLRLSYHGLKAKDKSFNASFETNFDKSLPKLNLITQDIGRVILNLINNAFYAINERKKKAEDGYQPKVIITTKQLGDRIEIKVSDNGSGIPEHIKSKIFQPFFTTKPAGQGTGLGLSLSYEIIVKGHGGSFELESTEGIGTEFIITLGNKNNSV